MTDKPILGIDLGGTKIGVGLVDRDGTIRCREMLPTLADQGPEAVIDRITAGAQQALDRAGLGHQGLHSIGIGAPGPLDILQGLLIEPPNLPGWHNVPLRQILQERFGVPAYLENDANAAAVGEYLYGAGQGTRDMIYVTVSTGIGGGLILDGQIYHGANGGAGEVGHMTILPNGPRCRCGNRGCLEALASGTAIAREGQHLVARGMRTAVAGQSGRAVTAKDVVDAMHQGDPYAQQIVARAMFYLGIGMANLVNLFNPQRIVIGGGLAALGDELVGPVRHAIDLHAFPSASVQVTTVLAQLGHNVGIVGAAGAAWMAAQRV